MLLVRNRTKSYDSGYVFDSSEEVECRHVGFLILCTRIIYLTRLSEFYFSYSIKMKNIIFLIYYKLTCRLNREHLKSIQIFIRISIPFSKV